MTRQEQIDHAAAEHDSCISCYGHSGFLAGAQWADENPKHDMVSTIDVTALANKQACEILEAKLAIVEKERAEWAFKAGVAEGKLAIAVDTLTYCADKLMSKKAKEALIKIHNIKGNNK